MAEVPEHLLARSAARRAALSGGEAPAATPATTGESTPATASAAPAAAPAKVVPTEPAFIEPVSKVAQERFQSVKRRRVPAWAMGVLALLPVWGVLYIGAFGTPKAENAAPDGSTLFANNCAACHGANGEGKVGPKLAGGEVLLTFPNIDDHVAWVTNGSAGVKGKGYGDPNRPGGQHIANTGGMPAFGGQLSPEEIEAVVEYERTGL